MKKKSFFAAVLYLLLLFVIINNSCTGTQKNISSGIIHKEYKYGTELSANHRVTFDVHLENIENANGNKNKLSGLITDLIYQNKDFDEYMAYTEKEFALTINEEDYPPSKDAQEPYQSQLIKNYFIEFFNDSFIIVKCSMYSYYSMHAHGDSRTQYFIIDTAEKRILDIDDLIIPVPQAEIKRILESKYTIDNYLRENIWPVDTVNFRAGGVELIWNVYTIAPYVYGTINVEVPYSDIERCLTAKGKKLKKARGS